MGSRFCSMPHAIQIATLQFMTLGETCRLQCASRACRALVNHRAHWTQRRYLEPPNTQPSGTHVHLPWTQPATLMWYLAKFSSLIHVDMRIPYQLAVWTRESHILFPNLQTVVMRYLTHYATPPIDQYMLSDIVTNAIMTLFETAQHLTHVYVVGDFLKYRLRPDFRRLGVFLSKREEAKHNVVVQINGHSFIDCNHDPPTVHHLLPAAAYCLNPLCGVINRCVHCDDLDSCDGCKMPHHVSPLCLSKSCIVCKTLVCSPKLDPI